MKAVKLTILVTAFILGCGKTIPENEAPQPKVVNVAKLVSERAARHRPFLEEMKKAALSCSSFDNVVIYLAKNDLEFRQVRVLNPDHFENITHYGVENHLYVPGLDYTFVRMPKYNWLVAVVKGDTSSPDSYALRLRAFHEKMLTEKIDFTAIKRNFPDVELVDTLPADNPVNVSRQPEAVYFSETVKYYFIQNVTDGTLADIRSSLDPANPPPAEAPYYTHAPELDLDPTIRTPHTVWAPSLGEIKGWLEKTLDKSKKTYLGRDADE